MFCFSEVACIETVYNKTFLVSRRLRPHVLKQKVGNTNNKKTGTYKWKGSTVKEKTSISMFINKVPDNLIRIDTTSPESWRFISTKEYINKDKKGTSILKESWRVDRELRV